MVIPSGLIREEQKIARLLLPLVGYRVYLSSRFLFLSIQSPCSQQRRIIFQHLHRASFDTLVLKLNSISSRNPNNVSSTVPLIKLIMLTYRSYL